jgi:hypothetical protein
MKHPVLRMVIRAALEYAQTQSYFLVPVAFQSRLNNVSETSRQAAGPSKRLGRFKIRQGWRRISSGGGVES